MFGIPIHKLIVHFPIVLTEFVFLYDCWALYAKKPELHRASYRLTLWAAVGALAAVGTGLQLADMLRIDKGAVTGHAGFALGTTIVVASLAGARYSAQAQERKEFQIWWLVLEAAAAALVFATAITGHRL